MPTRSQSELAEALRRAGTLTDDDLDRQLAYAIAEMDAFTDGCALLLAMAERRPSEPVKRALFYACHKTNEVAVGCAALLLYLCGHASKPFDPAWNALLAKFGKHVSHFTWSDGIAELSRLTGYTNQSPADFTFIERPGAQDVAPAQDVRTDAPAPPATQPQAAAWEPSFEAAADVRPTPQPHVATASGLDPTYEIETEMRGETIHYVEPTRRTSMMFFWTKGYQIHADTITTWRSSDGRQTPVTPQERVDVVARVVRYAREVQGVTLDVVHADWMHAQCQRPDAKRSGSDV